MLNAPIRLPIVDDGTPPSMSFYSGQMRQSGGGLGNIFGALARTLVPAISRVAVPFIKSQAKRLGPKLLRTGVGLMHDVAKSRNLKQAVKKRGKRLLASLPPRRRPAAVKRRRPAAKSAKRKPAKKRRRLDVFGV